MNTFLIKEHASSENTSNIITELWRSRQRKNYLYSLLALGLNEVPLPFPSQLDRVE